MNIYRAMRPADRAWVVLAAVVVAWDLVSPEGETLSEGAKRHAREQRVATLSTISYLAMHLSGVIPARYDPLSRASIWIDRMQRAWQTR